jgi:hypothetical protein
MVTHYPNPIASDEGLGPTADVHQAQDGIGTRVVWWLRQAVCALHGHDNLMQFEKDRMFLECVSCGRQSPGWALTEVPPPVRVRGDARHHAIARPHLVSARRIA